MTSLSSGNGKNNYFSRILTFEQPGVKAPGTPKMISFLFADNFAKSTLFVGLSSNKLALGSLSPSYNTRVQKNAIILFIFESKYLIHNN